MARFALVQLYPRFRRWVFVFHLIILRLKLRGLKRASSITNERLAQVRSRSLADRAAVFYPEVVGWNLRLRN